MVALAVDFLAAISPRGSDWDDKDLELNAEIASPAADLA
jgi:hypothetical protein